MMIHSGIPLFETTRQDKVLTNMISAAETTVLPGRTGAMFLLMMCSTFSQFLDGRAGILGWLWNIGRGSDFRRNSLSASAILLSFLS